MKSIFKKIRLIAADVDDTLVAESGMKLNPEYYDVIRRFQSKGVYFAGASGRPMVGIQIPFTPVKDDIFYMADNGTNVHAGDFSFVMKLEREDYLDLLADLQTLDDGYSLMICCPACVCVSRPSVEFRNVISRYGLNIVEMESLSEVEDCMKISVYHRGGIPEDVAAVLHRKWDDKFDVCIAGRVWLDFTAKGANKGYALEEIQRHYGISPEETVAFGNADNDIPMIRQAKYGYAVAGASDALKEAAYEVIGSMEEDAVLEKLKEILSDMQR